MTKSDNTEGVLIKHLKEKNDYVKKALISVITELLKAIVVADTTVDMTSESLEDEDL